MRRLRMHNRSDPKRKERRLLHRAALWIVEVQVRKRHANQAMGAAILNTLCAGSPIDADSPGGTIV
jgi:hypothetical protein